MGAYDKEKFDIGLLKQDGTTKVGLMLVQKNGVPQYHEYDDEYLADQQLTGVPGYGGLPPEKELAIRQDDWRAGFGLEVYDADDPKRYNYGINFDSRFRGMGILGPLAATATKPPAVTSAATLANTDFEAAGSWTPGERSEAQKHAGTYSWTINNTTASQDAATWSITWRSATFTFGCFVWCASASIARLAIWDGKSRTYSAYHTGGSSWEYLSVTMALASDADQLQCELVAGAVTSYFDDATIASPIAGAISFADFNDELYISYGQVLGKFNKSATAAFTAVAVLPAAITHLYPASVSGTDYLFICIGSSDAYWYMDTSDVLYESDLSNNYAKYFVQVGATFYESDTAFTVRKTVDPLNGGTAWSNQITVGQAADAITGLNEMGGVPYIMKEDRPYYISDTTAYVLTDETRTLTSSTGGVNSLVWSGGLFMPYGTQALLEYHLATTAFNWRQPAIQCGNVSGFTGRVQALAGDDLYLYAIIDNDTEVEIMCAHIETVDGDSEWRWHTLAELTLAGASSAYISNVYKKRLWIGSTDSDNSLYYYPITTQYGSISSDSDYTYQTGGYRITPWLHGNFKGDNKAFIKLTLLMADTTADIYFKAYYQKKGDEVSGGVGWTAIDGTNHFKTSPSTTRYIPVDSGSDKPVSFMMRFKFEGITNATSTSPKLLGYDVRGILVPSKRKIIDTLVRCCDKIELKGGGFDTGSASEIKTALDEADIATWPVTFYNIDGDTVYVRFLPMQCYIIKAEKGREYERHYRLILEEVTLS